MRVYFVDIQNWFSLVLLDLTHPNKDQYSLTMITSKTKDSSLSKIKLSDIKITQLSTEALNLLSMTTLRIRKASGKHFSFSDPKLLEKISYKYKRIDDPEINGLYREFKKALKRSLSASLSNQSIYA